MVAGALVLGLAACRPRPPAPPGPGATFAAQAKYVQRTASTTRPWFCNAAGNGTPPQGHGNGGHVNPAYAGKTKGPLTWADCLKFAGELDQTMAATKGYETKAKAEAAGWRLAAPYVPGLGTHNVGGPGGVGMAPPGGLPGPEEQARIRACLVEQGIDLSSGVPNFTDPAFMAALKACGVNLPTGGAPGGFTQAFDPAKPPLLIYGGNEPDAPLVGTGFIFVGDSPPEAYTGGNDWWHLHTKLCVGLPFDQSVKIDAEELSDEQCRALGGTPQLLFPRSDGKPGGVWLLHMWMIPSYEYKPDMFVSGHPCLGATAVLPQSDPCWVGARRDPSTVPTTTMPPMGSTTMPPMDGHDGDGGHAH
jgi:hypothetical protein